MFYNRKKTAFYIKDIFTVTRKKGIYENKSRPFAGLAMRIRGQSNFVFDEKNLSAPEGSVTYIPPGVSFDIHSGDEEVVIIHIEVFGETEDKITTVTPAQKELYEEFFKNAAYEWERRRPGYENRCMSILYDIFEALESTAVEKEKKAELIGKGVLYMNMYFDKRNVTIGEIAKKCNISEVYFRRIFKEEYGVSPLKYMNGMRIKKAKRLLKSGYYRIGEAAELAGFDDMKYFSSTFKKEVGITPTEYLKGK